MSERLRSSSPRPARPAAPPGSPTLVIVAGLPGRGKSWLARHLAAAHARRPGARPLVVVETDRIRLELTGGRPLHTPGENAAVHAEARRRLAAAIAAGAHAVIDATSLASAHRAQLRRLADRSGARTLLAWCELEDAVAARRFALRRGRLDAADVSTADEAVAERMAAAVERPRRALHVRPSSARAAVRTLAADLAGLQEAEEALL
ncbi:MAG: hypothetical protein A2X23_05570 [Chloroflexi bacterium GWC2_73_18]|nr:MAG: hypothetical protein A2X23_05570 [Chloroflexi bacterium GWC2_73_18]